MEWLSFKEEIATKNTNLRISRRFFYFRDVIDALPSYVYFIILSILAGITVYFKRPVPLYLRLFPLFLILILIFELISAWMIIHTGNNLSITNINTIVSFIFYLNFFRVIVNNHF